MCVKLRPEWLESSNFLQAIPIDLGNPGFVPHPSTSELAEQLMVDPEALSSESYRGLYDDNGDYLPQYCDDPEKIPKGAEMTPNPADTIGASNQPGNDGGDAGSSGAGESPKDVGDAS